MTDLAVRPTTTLRAYMTSEDIMNRFSQVVGNGNAGAYISSALIAVSENKALQECSPNSIVASALRAATMRLSVDPSAGHAYLVPFKGRAVLVVGYKGLYHMAIRTNKYRDLNLIDIYEDDELVEDRMTGNITLKIGETQFVPAQRNSRLNQKKVIGYMLYFKLYSGFSKTFFMTNEECDAHGEKYSKSFHSPTGAWQTNRNDMRKKTVMRVGLTKWGYMDPADIMQIKQAEEEESEIVDSETGEVLNPENMNIEVGATITYDQAMEDLTGTKPQPAKDDQPKQPYAAMTYEQACDVTGSDGKRYGNCTDAELKGKQIGINKALKKSDVDARKQSEYQNKLEAIQILLAVPEPERMKISGQMTIEGDL